MHAPYYRIYQLALWGVDGENIGTTTTPIIGATTTARSPTVTGCALWIASNAGASPEPTPRVGNNSRTGTALA